MRGLSIPISTVPLKSALSTTDPTIPWRSFTAKEFESFKVEGLRGDSIIDAGESEGRSRLDTRWYKVATNSGMANGLHRYDFSGIRGKEVHERSVSQLVEDVMKRKRVISRPASGATRLVKVYE